MSKQMKNIIVAVLILIALVGAIAAYFLTKKDSPKEVSKDNTSSVTSDTINVEDIENTKTESGSESSKDTSISYLEPDETKADEILEEKRKDKTSNASSGSDKTPSDNTTENSKPTQSSTPPSFEEGKKELENTAEKYLKEHNIDPKTAGETGELCQHCSKKIWNPDKYGFFIPGIPENYETSGYCLGTCGITFE